MQTHEATALHATSECDGPHPPAALYPLFCEVLAEQIVGKIARSLPARVDPHTIIGQLIESTSFFLDCASTVPSVIMLTLCRTLIDQLGPLLDQPMPVPRAMMHLFKLHDAVLSCVLEQAAKAQIHHIPSGGGHVAEGSYAIRWLAA